MSVLLVEDEPTISITLRDDLEEHGYVVTHTGNGAAAVVLLAKHRFGAVITDLRLPGADGLQVVRAARRSSPDARVLVITAFAKEHIPALMREGAGRVLQKPFLNHCVLDWLEGQPA